MHAFVLKAAAVAAGILATALPTLAAKGAVVYRISGCDYFVVQTTKGYDVLEWYGGWDASKGDDLVGSFEQYGMRDVVDTTADESMRVWVQEYWLTKEDALEKLVEKCE
jgi:hypothetical protein